MAFRLAGSVAWGGVALICVAVLTLHLMREASARHEAEADHRWQAKFDATPANAPLAKWTEQLETAAPARRKDVLAAMRKVPTRQRDAETLLDGDAFPIGALGVIDLDPTQSLCEKARASLVRGAARLLPLAPGSREFREIADKFDAAADALEWLVANGCDCGDASRAWEAIARGYLDPNFDVARLKRLRDREAVERLRESNVKNFSLLTPRSSLQAWLRFADDRKFGVEALIGARSLEHRTGDAIEALSSEFDPDGAATVLRFLPTLDLDPTTALCRAALREVRRQLAAVSRPPLSGPRSYSALLEETAREQPLAALQWLAAHGCPAEAELADAQALVSAYEIRRRAPRCSPAWRSFAESRSRDRNFRSTFLCGLDFPLGQRTQAQRIELDEACGVAVVVGDGSFLEGDEILVVERMRAVAPDHVDSALVELETDAAGDQFLALVYHHLQQLSLRREPEAVVDQLRVSRHQLVLEMSRATVERDQLDRAMRCE